MAKKWHCFDGTLVGHTHNAKGRSQIDGHWNNHKAKDDMEDCLPGVITNINIESKN
jgi:hypothetical protein